MFIMTQRKYKELSDRINRIERDLDLLGPDEHMFFSSLFSPRQSEDSRTSRRLRAVEKLLRLAMDAMHLKVEYPAYDIKVIAKPKK